MRLTILKNEIDDSQKLESGKNYEQAAFNKEAIRACARKKDMVEHNVAKVLSNGMPIAQIEATNEGTGSKQADDDKAGGLANSIILSKHTKVRLTTNLWLSAGLTNGAAGTVTHILYKEGHAPPELPLAVIVSFDNYKEPNLLPNYPSSVPIVPIRRTWNQNLSKDKQCARTMLPLML